MHCSATSPPLPCALRHGPERAQQRVGPLFKAIVTITIDTENSAPTGISLDNLVVDADVPGAVFGALTTTDPDVEDAHSYSVSDNRFVVDGGVLRLADGVSLAAGEVVALRVTSTDLRPVRHAPSGWHGCRSAQSRDHRLPQIAAWHAAREGISLSSVTALALEQFDLQQPRCSTSPSLEGPFVDTPTPRSLGNFSLPVPGNIDLQAADLYKVGEPMFVRVRDIDPNKDPLARESIVITLSVDASRDTEILLIETGPDTAEFVGYVQSTSRANDNYDCVLWSRRRRDRC